MIVLPQMAMSELMSRIVEASHGLTDENGNRHVLSTIPETQLRMAAIVAIQIASGEAIWPGDRAIVLREQKQSYGIFRVER